MDLVVFWGKIDVFLLVPLSGLKTNQKFCSFKLKNCKNHSFAWKLQFLVKTSFWSYKPQFLAENHGLWAFQLQKLWFLICNHEA